MTEHQLKVMRFVCDAAVYVPFNREGIRISYYDTDADDDNFEGAFWGVGEESGDEYKILYEDVDLENDSFYQLVEMKFD